MAITVKARTTCADPTNMPTPPQPMKSWIVSGSDVTRATRAPRRCDWTWSIDKLVEMAEGADPEVGEAGGRRGGEPRQCRSLRNHPGGDGEEGETAEGDCALDVHAARRRGSRCRSSAGSGSAPPPARRCRRRRARSSTTALGPAPAPAGRRGTGPRSSSQQGRWCSCADLVGCPMGPGQAFAPWPPAFGRRRPRRRRAAVGHTREPSPAGPR